MSAPSKLESKSGRKRKRDADKSADANASADHKELVFVEPLLRPNPGRFVLFPVVHGDMYKMYELHLKSFWTKKEINLSQDLVDWKTLNANEQHFIKHVLAFFAASDGIVVENLAARFIKEVQVPEARLFYGFQLAMENIHSETYSLLLETLVSDASERSRLFRAIETIPCVAAKSLWAIKWIDGDGAQESFATRLVAFAIVEGIFFSGSFCAIFWLKKRGKMHGLTFSNELISRDEGLHFEFACLLYRDHIQRKLSTEQVHELMREAVKIEKDFICDSIPVDLIGMNSKLMSQYIEFVANYTCLHLGHPILFPEARNPFEWMEMISMQGKTNMFERRISEYAMTTVSGEFQKDAEF